MTVTLGGSHLLADQLSGIGFCAGITLKAQWENQDGPYAFIREKILQPDVKLLAPTQVHGARVIDVDREEPKDSEEADGTISRSRNICLTVTTADCIPMLFADPVSGAFAAIHVGWRSFVAGIIENVFVMARDLGISMPDTQAFLGPSIGACCFEVGPEVAVLFDRECVQSRNGRSFVDLRRAARNKVETIGVSKVNISGNDSCTSCDSDRYYSYRRDKETPVQMVSFIFKST